VDAWSNGLARLDHAQLHHQGQVISDFRCSTIFPLANLQMCTISTAVVTPCGVAKPRTTPLTRCSRVRARTSDSTIVHAPQLGS
jgi:hypothetical protein